MVTKQGLYTPDKTDRKVASIKNNIKCVLANLEACEGKDGLITQLMCRPKTCCKYHIRRKVQDIFERNTY